MRKLFGGQDVLGERSQESFRLVEEVSYDRVVGVGVRQVLLHFVDPEKQTVAMIPEDDHLFGQTVGHFLDFLQRTSTFR